MVVTFLQLGTKLTLLDQLLNIRKGAHSSRIPFYSGMSCLSRYSPCHQQLVLTTCTREMQALAARGRNTDFSIQRSDQRMRNDELSLSIEISAGFARDIARGTPVQIGARVDGAMPSNRDFALRARRPQGKGFSVFFNMWVPAHQPTRADGI